MFWLQAGHLQSRYWGKSEHRNQDLKVEHGWKDPHEHFLIDNERFVMLFTKILPWGQGDLGREMALRCFKVTSCSFLYSILSLIFRFNLVISLENDIS